MANEIVNVEPDESLRTWGWVSYILHLIVAVGAVLLHSAVDYPLRTETIAVVFALCCALLELAVLSEARLNPKRSGRRSTNTSMPPGTVPAT